jgi:opacity protein-like surface antigen
MTSTRIATILGAALLLTTATVASAADLYGNGGGGSIKDTYVPADPVGPSWYVRIDGTYGDHDEPVMVEDHIYDLVDTNIDGTWSLGGGIGRYFTHTIRGDVTYDHRFETDAEGTLLGHVNGLNGVRQFGLESDVVLFNLYYDFNRMGRFNPYVGVGLGVTKNTTTAGTVTDDCGCTGTIAGDSETHVAGALMAGFTAKLRGGHGGGHGGWGSRDGAVAVDSGRGLYLDVGYRFLYLGEGTTGPITLAPVGGAPTVISDDPTVEDIHAHELRIGLRYDIR